MKLDPNTRLASLLIAIPSTAAVLETFEITIDGNEEKSVQELCREHGITFQTFLKGMDNLNWNEEYRE
jgi:23S rRNA C2498 (ribose-2'-O)-methylase RlmM